VTGVWKSGETGAVLTRMAFENGLPGRWGGIVVTLSVASFAFSTLLGWGYYGERNMDRLFGRAAVMPYRIAFVVAILVGAVLELQVVWTFADIMNGLMALPNLIGLLLLSGLIVRETREFFSRPDWRDIVASGKPPR
jgi:AGCS family alanine or glycine:cation symporter